MGSNPTGRSKIYLCGLCKLAQLTGLDPDLLWVRLPPEVQIIISQIGVVGGIRDFQSQGAGSRPVFDSYGDISVSGKVFDEARKVVVLVGSVQIRYVTQMVLLVLMVSTKDCGSFSIGSNPI